MHIRVLFFGATADAAGTPSRSLDTDEGASAASVVDSVVAIHPGLKHHKLLFSVNEEYVSGDIRLSDGDELAIFTAVSGG